MSGIVSGNFVRRTGDTMVGDLTMQGDIIMNAGKTVDELDLGALPIGLVNFTGGVVATGLSVGDADVLVDCSAVCGAKKALLMLAIKCTNSGNRYLAVWCPDFAFADIDVNVAVSNATVYVGLQDVYAFICVKTDSSGRIKVRRADGATQTWTINVLCSISEQ